MDRKLVILGGSPDQKKLKPSIGGSAYLLVEGDAGLLIDCGIYPQSMAIEETPKKIEFETVGNTQLPILPKSCLLDDSDLVPAKVEGLVPDLKRLEAIKNLYVVVTHAHADHCGAVPFLKRIFPTATIMMTEATLDISLWSWNDYLKIMKRREQRPLFTTRDIAQVRESVKVIHSGSTKKIGPFELSFFPAGHVLGAISVMARVGGKDSYSIFFSSDISFCEQYTTPSAPLLNAEMLGTVKYLVMESTYAGKDPIPRKKVEQTLIQDIKKCLEAGGKVLLPVLSIGRAAEICYLLQHYGISGRWPIWIDGSARQLIDIYIKYGFLKNFVKEWFVGSDWERNDLLESNRPCVVLAPAGMMTGGYAILYAQKWASNPKNLIGLTCYQVPGSAGHRLLRSSHGEKVVLNKKDNIRVTLLAKVSQYPLSAHASDNDLQDMVARFNPNTVFMVHGEESNMTALASRLDEKAKIAFSGQEFAL